MKLSRLSNRQLRRLLAQGEVRFAFDDIDENRKKEIFKLIKGQSKVLGDCIKELKDLRTSYAHKILNNSIYWGPGGKRLKFEKMLTQTWLKLGKFIEELEEVRNQANIDARDFK